MSAMEPDGFSAGLIPTRPRTVRDNVAIVPIVSVDTNAPLNIN